MWIAVLGPVGSGTVRFRDSSGGSGGSSPSETSKQTTLLVLPATWAKGTTYKADGPLSAWGG